MSIQNFIPEVWTAGILTAMYEAHVFAQPGVVNRNYEGEIRSQGDTVHITGIEPVSVRPYQPMLDISFDEIDLNTRTMFIDQADYFALRIDDIDKWQAKGDVMGPALTEAGYTMSKKVDTYVATQMKAGVHTKNIIPAVGVSGDVSADGAAIRHAFVQLWTRLERNNVPSQGRYAIVSPEIYAILLEDPQFVEADKSGTTSVLRNGVVGSMYGFTILISNNTPNGTATVDSATVGAHTILAGNNTGFSFADALVETEAVRFEKSFGDGIKGLHVYGGKMIRPEGLCRIDVQGPTMPVTPVVSSFRDTSEADLDSSRFKRANADGTYNNA